MVGIKKLALLLIAGLPALSSSDAEKLASDYNQPRASLFVQSAGQILSREYGNCHGAAVSRSCSQSDRISFLALDAHTGAVIASRWENPEKPVPLGSLVKPFTALAYGERHQFIYPTHVCRGTSTGCWLPRGHGEVDLASAIANSCNSYFRMLTANMSVADVSPVTGSFGLQLPAPESSGFSLAGVGTGWLISPLSMANAYLELIRRRDQPGVRQVLAGMAQSAWRGTGAEVDRALEHPEALVKTGTALCTHSKHAPGDGFVIAMIPAGDPQILVMVRVHGVPGAQAAQTAGQMLRRIEE